MLQDIHRRRRDEEREAQERQRYELLERIYLLTGADCETGVYPWQMEEELGPGAAAAESVWEDLIRLGYLKREALDGPVCITPEGVEYLQTRAWRRRSIRDP